MSIIIFLIILFVLVLVHEWGHFIVAKKTGMRVDEFGIGFPPRLFGFTWRGTLYTFNLLPIGGFVSIYGENAEATGSDGKKVDVSGSFTSKSKWAQTAVLFAGVIMNIAFAWLLLLFVFMIGVPTTVNEDTASSAAVLVIQSVLPESPAATAGLPAGAEILRLEADQTFIDDPTPTQFRELTEATTDVLLITYAVDGKTVTTSVTPQSGLLAGSEQKAIGVGLGYVETIHLSFVAAVAKASTETIRLLGAITVGLSTLIVESIQGTADYSQIAGPVGIVGLVSEAAAFGVIALMMFTAIISLNLAVINLLPFPALDGGRLIFVAIEAVIRRPINPVWVARINGLGFVLLILLMIAVTYSDITKLL